MWGGVLGFMIIAALGARLVYVFRRKRALQKAEADTLFAGALQIVESPVFEPQGPHQFPKLKGIYQRFPIQVHPVVDTLATRRLPALWLLVTVQDTLPLTARFDMMMRPAGPTTFSNFDHLPDTLKHPGGFPEHAVIRTDDADAVLPAEIIRPHLGLFAGPRAKELLITGNGIRIVWLLAESDRVRYGIFRQADFGTVAIEPQTLKDIADCLLAIRQAIRDWDEAKK